jgi:cytidine deaminase
LKISPESFYQTVKFQINNSYETIILNTNIENYEQNFRTRAIAENSSINNMISKDFSYFYSINTNIDNLNNNNFSLFLNNKW